MRFGSALYQTPQMFVLFLHGPNNKWVIYHMDLLTGTETETDEKKLSLGSTETHSSTNGQGDGYHAPTPPIYCFYSKKNKIFLQLI
jgi:hypothetical protein